MNLEELKRRICKWSWSIPCSTARNPLVRLVPTHGTRIQVDLSTLPGFKLFGVGLQICHIYFTALKGD